MRKPLTTIAIITSGLLASSPLMAQQDVTFQTNLLFVCTPTPSAGSLGPNTDYTQLSTQNGGTGGAAATVAMVALGGPASVTFSAPTITNSAVTPEISYTSLSGVSQPFTSAQTTSNPTLLTDTFTINARASDPSGFGSGNYTITTTATCSG